jgi:hypothetical protein
MRKEIFEMWFKFGIFYFLISIGWSFSTSIPMGGGGGIAGGTSPGLICILLAVCFSVFSTLLIIATYTYFYFKNRQIKK